ncbi:MAG: transglycosylase domain-containing protein [Clostridia bacterium]
MIEKRNKSKDKKEFKKIKNKKEKTPEQIKRKKKIKIFILVLIVILTLYIGISTAISLNKFKKLIKDMSVNENSIVIDSDGNTIAEIGSEKTKEKIKAEEIPSNLKNAYVAIEDERYYKHGGIDVKRTTSAIISYVFHRGSSSFGGSSITQQLVKNLTGDSSNKISRKVNEWKKQ